MAATCRASVDVQRITVRAAMTGDVTLLKQAVLHDPLTGAICTPDEVWQMVDEMLVAQAQWPPQYADAIPAATERMKSPKIATRDWSGAARLDVRSVAELREVKRAGFGRSRVGHARHGLSRSRGSPPKAVGAAPRECPMAASRSCPRGAG